MARRIPGDLIPGVATLDLRGTNDPKIWEVYVMPSDERLREQGFDPDVNNVEMLHLVTLDANRKRFDIHPFYTRPEPDGAFTPKDKQIGTISFDWDDPNLPISIDDVSKLLERQPRGFTIDPNFGLGLKKEYKAILLGVTALSSSETLYIGDGEATSGEFKVSPADFGHMTNEIDRIDRRAQTAETEVKNTTAFNILATSIGQKARPFRLGRNEIRQLIQNFAHDPDYRDPNAQVELTKEIGRAARTFAARAPEAAERLVSDVQLTRLEIAIQEFETLMGKNHNEDKWQEFFQNDPFLLTFAFGYPIAFVNGQSYVGGRRIDGKGEKISDFLYKNSLNNNAALIEIKKPQTPLLRAYRDGVFAPHEELSGGITQILDQRYRLVSNFAQHAKDNEWWGKNEVADYEIDCILVAGCMPAEKDKRRSFQLYRKNSHGVRIVTFDEVLQQLKQVQEFLRESKPARANAPATPATPRRGQR